MRKNCAVYVLEWQYEKHFFFKEIQIKSYDYLREKINKTERRIQSYGIIKSSKFVYTELQQFLKI